jgi:polyisoprenoid-binding protein YceI
MITRAPYLAIIGVLAATSIAAAQQQRAQTFSEQSPPPALATVVAPYNDSVPIINLAICLDTSGSMEGLINAARQNIWEIVNDLALAEPTPDLRVALLTYGNDGHNAEDGWVFIQTDFTDDLDLVSERLFALTTNGGTELVGRVLHRSITQLTWSDSPEALKIVVVAGNESADQDQQVSYRDVCRSAIGQGVMVNSIYCGNPGDGIAPGWREVAQLADGHFSSIDQNNGTVVVTTPFDDELTRLSASINETYVAYTPEGQWAAGNQEQQDCNAAQLNSAAAANRAMTKCNALYKCNWDLVTACQQEDFKLEEVDAEQLPEEMRSMTLEQQRAHLEQLSSKRAAIQAQIQEIGQKRQTFVAQEMKRQALDDGNSFNSALRGAVRSQAETKGYQFPEPPAPKATFMIGEGEAATGATAEITNLVALHTQDDLSDLHIEFTADLETIPWDVERDAATTAVLQRLAGITMQPLQSMTFRSTGGATPAETGRSIRGELTLHSITRTEQFTLVPDPSGIPGFVLRGTIDLADYDPDGTAANPSQTVEISLNVTPVKDEC